MSYQEDPTDYDDPPLWSPEEVEDGMVLHTLLTALGLLVIACVVLADYFSY